MWGVILKVLTIRQKRSAVSCGPAPSHRRRRGTLRAEPDIVYSAHTQHSETLAQLVPGQEILARLTRHLCANRRGTCRGHLGSADREVARGRLLPAPGVWHALQEAAAANGRGDCIAKRRVREELVGLAEAEALAEGVARGREVGGESDCEAAQPELADAAIESSSIMPMGRHSVFTSTQP